MRTKSSIISNEAKFWITSSLFSLFIVAMAITSADTDKHETIIEELLTYKTHHLEKNGGNSFCVESQPKDSSPTVIRKTGFECSLIGEDEIDNHKFIELLN